LTPRQASQKHHKSITKASQKHHKSIPLSGMCLCLLSGKSFVPVNEYAGCIWSHADLISVKRDLISVKRDLISVKRDLISTYAYADACCRMQTRVNTHTHTHTRTRYIYRRPVLRRTYHTQTHTHTHTHTHTIYIGGVPSCAAEGVPHYASSKLDAV
jgi:hypothetical protein